MKCGSNKGYRCFAKGGLVPSMPKMGAMKLPRPTQQATNITQKVPEVSAAPFLGPSLTARPKPRRM